MRTASERFWEKVDKSGNCWEWRAAKDRYGYGRFGISKEIGYAVPAQRAAWFIVYGEMPKVSVLHKCDNPGCVNPEHLFLGTQQDNLKDMNAKGRNGSSLKTHCPQGHPYAGSNLARYGNARFCRACSRLASKRYMEKRNAMENNRRA